MICFRGLSGSGTEIDASQLYGSRAFAENVTGVNNYTNSEGGSVDHES